jgi:hypothetical protein
MPSYLTEAKPQCWRAVAIFEDGREALIYLGLSSQKIREGYGQAYFEVLDDEERAMIKTISLQRWNGAPDAGKWSQTTTLTMPTTPKKLVKVAA